MAIKDVLKVSRKTFLNPSGWLGLPEVKDSFKTTWGILKSLITPASSTRTETFEEAMQRLNQTEADVKKIGQDYLMYCWVFIALGVASLVFGFYLLIHHWTIIGFLLSFAMTSLFFSQAFRYHFWHFQIKFRKLGCTFDEWWRGKPNSQGG